MAKRAVFITGAAGGIGAALVRAYRDAGWYVVGSDRQASDQARCDAYISADLSSLASDEGALIQVVSEVRGCLRGLQLCALVNNAAAQILGPTEQVGREAWQHTLNVNLTAPFLLAQAFLPDLEAASTGTILNIGSVHAQATKPEFVAYATSKAALHGMTRALAVDLGKRVRVVCLAPAAISTPMLLAGFEGREAAFRSLEACHPAERIGHAQEVADAALFLTGESAGFATGTTFWLDGGILSRLHDPV